MKKYTLFKGVEYPHSRFFSLSKPGDQTRTADGKVSYDIIGEADTVREAQTKLYGYSVVTHDE